MLRQPLEPLKSPALSVCARACACAPADFHPLVDSITYSDYYLLANDFPDYIATQERIDQVYCDQAHWTKMSIMSTAGSGFFSSDRTIESVRGWGAAGGRAGGGGMAVVAAAVAVAWQWWRWLCGWVGRGGTWGAAGGWAEAQQLSSGGGAVAEEQQLPLPCKLSGHWHLTAGSLCRLLCPLRACSTTRTSGTPRPARCPPPANELLDMRQRTKKGRAFPALNAELLFLNRLM